MQHLFMALLKFSIRIYQINIMAYKTMYTCYEIFHMNIPKKNIFMAIVCSINQKIVMGGYDI